MSGDASRGPERVAVRKLRPDEVEPILDVMTRAFDADPVISFVVKQDRRRAARLRGFLNRIFLEPCLPHGETYITDGLEGGAFWIPPGKRESGLFANLRLLPHLVRAAGLARVPGLVSAMDVIDKKHPHEPHFYLPMIGIDPPHQGRGLGSALMRPILERCDRDGTPAYLESSNERNVPLYERNGFRVTEEVRLGRTGPAMWLMWRDSQAVTPGLRPGKRGLAT